MTATLQEAISCRGRVGADALGKSRLTDVTDHRCVDEAVRQSDDQNGGNDNDGAEQAIAYHRRSHEADHHKTNALLTEVIARIKEQTDIIKTGQPGALAGSLAAVLSAPPPRPTGRQ